MNKNQIHLWCLPLDKIGKLSVPLKEFESLLSSDEKKRAERIIVSKMKRQFMIGRYLMRLILGEYLQEDPSKIKFGYGKYGKLFLKNVKSKKQIQFSFSHSYGFGLLGITEEQAIGVDVERVKPFKHSLKIIERFVSSHEAQKIKRLLLAQRREAFFTAWTRHEAIIKMKGLSVFSAHDDGEKNGNYSYKKIRLSEKFIGAVITEGSQNKFVKLFHL